MSVPIETAPTFRPGTPSQMFDLPPFYSSAMIRTSRQWDVAPDGERFLIVSPGGAATGDHAQSRIVVVLNWFSELQQRVPTR